MDKSAAHQAAQETPITIRLVKYLNNIVERDHRAVKRITQPMLGFKSFRTAQAILAGIELMHMIRKNQFMMQGCAGMASADHFTRWQDKSVQRKDWVKPSAQLPIQFVNAT